MGLQFEGLMMKRKTTNANSKQLPGEYAKLPHKVAKALQQCPAFCSDLLGPITEYLTAGIPLPNEPGSEWGDFAEYNIRLEHLKDAIEIIDATQRKRLFSKVGNWQPVTSKRDKAKVLKRDSTKQLRQDVGQMLNQAIDRANNRR
jgi:hypothetical protein